MHARNRAMLVGIVGMFVLGMFFQSCSTRRKNRIACIRNTDLVGCDLFDLNREIHLEISKGVESRYWIEDDSDADESCWHLEHVRCQPNGCLFRCRETAINWLLSIQNIPGNNSSILMDKQQAGSNFPICYMFQKTEAR